MLLLRGVRERYSVSKGNDSVSVKLGAPDSFGDRVDAFQFIDKEPDLDLGNVLTLVMLPFEFEYVIFAGTLFMLVAVVNVARR